jgi:Ulp1 family protease
MEQTTVCTSCFALNLLIECLRILKYPPGKIGLIKVTNANLARLEPEALINDTIIELGLK